MSTYMISKKTMELNPNHSIVVELKKKSDTDKTDKTVKDLIKYYVAYFFNCDSGDSKSSISIFFKLRL